LFKNYRTLMLEFNKTQEIDSDKIEHSMHEFLKSYKEAGICFSAFGKNLVENGNLTEKLLEFIQ
ncbi:MAG: hypothetical protein J5857_01785, partial [Treponema sp.]|nr:hypothetical protein [Treponema sp.]